MAGRRRDGMNPEIVGLVGTSFVKMHEQDPDPKRLVYVWTEGHTDKCVWDAENRAFLHPTDRNLVLYFPSEVTHWKYCV